VIWDTMKELIESLVFVMPVVAGLFGLLQIYLLYLTFKLAANSITEFRSNQIWVENRKDAAQIINLLNLVERKVVELSRLKSIESGLWNENKDEIREVELYSSFPELKTAYFLFIKFTRSKEEILRIISEIESLEHKIKRQRSLFLYRSYLELMISVQTVMLLVVEFRKKNKEDYLKIYTESLNSNVENFLGVEFHKFELLVAQRKEYYIGYLHQHG